MRYASATIGGTPRVVDLVPRVTDPTRWMYASMGCHPPINVNNVNSAASQVEWVQQSMRSPDYWCSEFAFAWSNWYTNNSPSTTPETSGSVPQTIVGASVSFDNGATWLPLTFSGSASVTVPVDANAWGTVTLPAPVKDRQYLLRTASSVAGFGSGVRRVGNLRNANVPVGAPQPLHQLTTAADTNTAGFAAGTYTPAWGAAQGGYFWGPSLCLARGGANGTGWDGRPVVSLHGDSIGWGAGDGGNGQSWLTYGLDDNSSLKVPWANFCVPSTSATNQTGYGATAYQRKAALIAQATALNAGLPPCTAILSEMGRNDGHQNSTFVPLIRSWWDFLRTLYPAGLPLTQTLITPSTTGSGDWSRYDTQVNVNGDTYLPADNAQIVADAGTAHLEHYIDALPYITGPSTPTDYSLKIRVPSPQFTTTLAAAAVSGQNYLDLVDAPSLNMVLSVAVDTPAVDSFPRVTSVKALGAGGTGPFRCQFDYGNKVTGNAFASGVGVRQQFTYEGLHPNNPDQMKLPVVAAKNAGYFGSIVPALQAA